MIRNLKTLGLALVSVFVFSAVAASAASAQQGEFTSDGPVTMTAEETGANQNFLTAFGLKVECPGSTYTGHKYNVTPHQFLPNGVTTATVTPHYNQEKCVSGGFPVRIDMNGCDYVIHLGETTGKEDTYGMTLDVVCPVEKTIAVTVFTTEARLTENKPFCILDIKGQAGLKGAHLTDTENGHVDVSGAVEGIHVLRTNGGEDTLLCPNNTTTVTAQFNLDVTTKGHNEAGGSTPVSISD